MSDSTKVVGTPSYAKSSKRVITAILAALTALATICTLLANLKPIFTIIGGCITAVIVCLNTIFGLTATGPVTTQKP